MKNITTLLIASLLSLHIWAQDETPWNGKSFAVVFTYDDGLNVHLDNAIPALDKYGLKGTFYIPGKSTLDSRIDEWRMAAKHGHELGNHTLFHPCDGSKPNRSWVNPDYDLNTYSKQRITSEIEIANTLLHAVDGETERTFAYTCCETVAGGESFMDYIAEKFAAARGGASSFNNLKDLELFNLNSFSVKNQQADELIALVDQAKEKNTLLIFMFHGVGGGHSLNIDLQVHNSLLKYISEQNDCWNATMVDLGRFINSYYKAEGISNK